GDLRLRDLGLVEAVRPAAVERRAEEDVADAGRTADEADLGQIGPGATVRAAGHADDDLVPAQPGALDRRLQPRHEVGQIALALGQRQAAASPRPARQRVPAEAGQLAEQTVLAQQRLDLPLPATGDTRHDQVLVRGQDEAAVVALGEAAEPGAHLAGNTPVGDVEAEVPE